MHTKLRLLCGALLSSLLLVANAARGAIIDINFDYSNTTGSSVVFDGSSGFTFTPSMDNFKITSPGPLVDLLGEITGSYTIGSVTTVMGVSTAPVTGTGTFVVHDGMGFDLTGTLDWMDIYQFGAVTGLNTMASVNVTGLTYGGTNATLLSHASAPSNGATVLSFKFDAVYTLAE